MSTKQVELRLEGLTKLQALDLQKQLGAGAVQIHTKPAASNEFGDLVTTVAIVTIGVQALRVLAVWLATPRTEHNLKVKLPDGTEIDISHRSSGDPSEGGHAAVLKNLESALKVQVPSALGN